MEQAGHERVLLVAVGAVVLVEALFYSAIVPLLPHYASTLHLSKAGTGILLGAYTCGSFIGALPAAILTARVGDRQTLLAGLLVLGTSSAVFGLAHSLWLLDALRAAQGVGSALSWTGALAWLVSATPSERRGDLLGRALAAAAAGGLVGPGVGAIASSVGTGATFVVLGVATSALVLPVARLGSPPPPAAPSARHLVAALGQRTVAGGLWLMALPSMMVGAVGVLAPLKMSRLGLGAVVIGSIFVLAAIVESLSSVVAGRWADRSGRHSPLKASLVAVVVFSCALPAARDAWLFSTVVVLAAAAYGAFFAPAMALLTDVVEGLAIGPGFGFALLMAAWAPGQLLGSVGGGELARHTGDAGPYLVLAGLAALTLSLRAATPATRACGDRFRA